MTRQAARFLRRNPLAAAGGGLLLALLLAVALAPLWPLSSPVVVDLPARLRPPGAAHWLGTDAFGRDLLARLLHGGRATLAIGFGVVALAFAVGVPFGLLAGYAGGWPDLVMMRLVDALLAFPALVLAIALAAAFGPGLGNAMLAVAITLAPQFARLARLQARRIAALPYVEAAIAMGTPPSRLILRHILPNGIGPLLVQASLALGSAVLQTASLGFLGLGAQPPWPEWGADVSAGLALLRATPWVALVPGLAILLAVLCCNLLGDALAEWFNPRRRLS